MVRGGSQGLQAGGLFNWNGFVPTLLEILGAERSQISVGISAQTALCLLVQSLQELKTAAANRGHR